MKIKFFLLILLTLFAFDSNPTHANETNYYYVYGRNHLFKVYTPDNWINDIELAHSVGIAVLFHPRLEVLKNSQPTDIYIYAQGWDVKASGATLEQFIKEDTQRFKSQHQNSIVSQIPFKYEGHDGIIKAVYNRFEQLNGLYEDCVYFETDKSVITVVYSGVNAALYSRFKPTFDEFLSKFQFVSSDPATIAKILEEDKKLRPNARSYPIRENKGQ